ncbi:hypothetical protein HALLA_12525 [Halostagnicola larsenii XH-48]|uniref:Uncharacterized protein n=1 Tax=Halostagnicola larsenii XH-48 TaxID=797299 RepID=W0JLM0_9EURY|nr:DUF6159 family protein [Halostagnicola larsenii]AHF99488.1 hypothetical protein HALLA_12525 [Halostagnicola larsenii XH-48]
MGYYSRLKTGFVLSIASVRVLWLHPKLALYPLGSAITAAVFMGALLGPLFLAAGTSFGAVELAVLFVVYLGTTYITALFNAGLVYSVREVFHGNDPHVGDGLRAAAGNSGTLLIWAFVSAVIGIVIQSLESRGEIASQLVAMVFSFGWTIATFFVIPVIVFQDDVTARSMFTDSASTFKETWGETVGTTLGLGIVPALIVLPGGALAIGLLVLSENLAMVVIAITIALAAIVLSMLVGGVITGVAKTALYVYATEDIQPDEFDRFDFDSMFETDGGDSAKISTGPGGLKNSNRGI